MSSDHIERDANRAIVAAHAALVHAHSLALAAGYGPQVVDPLADAIKGVAHAIHDVLELRVLSC